MRYLMKFHFPVKEGNNALMDPEFGEKMQRYLTDIKAETAYFTAIEGQRGAYVVFNMDDASQIPSVAEPLFLWLNAEIEFTPVMLIKDLAKAGTSIAAAVKQWAR